jgi:UDP-3-O-[3-hydroxymyristoyl] glucosamine N-acyltransferase
MKMKRRVSEIAAAVGARALGDASIEVSGVSSIAAASPGDLVFAEDEKSLAAALQSRTSAVIVGNFTATVNTSKVILIASHPRLAFVRAAELLRDPASHKPGVHSGAAVDQSARLGEAVSIDTHASVEANARVGNRTWIGANSVIGAGVEIGDDCKIYPNVTIYSGTKLGDRVIVHAGAVLGSDGFGYVRDEASGRHEKFPQIGKLEIEDDVEIGANTTIDRGALETTRIGQGTKIDNLVHIGHNCIIGENVIIAAQAGFSGSITIEDNVIIGGQVGVGEHARIEEGVMIGGQGGVLPKKVLRGKGVAFWGTPAKPLREYLKQLAALARLGKKE